MWHQVLCRAAAASGPSRVAYQSFARHLLHSTSSLTSLRAVSSTHCSSSRRRRHRFLSTQSADGINDAAAISSNHISDSTDSATADWSGAPGIETSGDKLVMVYTCSVCETRSAKTISKHAYDKGVVLIRCPGCENLHLVADRLGWFEDDDTDVESLLAQKGEQVRFVTEENVLELTENDILGTQR